MAKEKKEKNTTTALAPGKTVLDNVSKKQVINMQLLEPEVRKEVATLTNQLKAGMAEVGTSMLRVGEILSKIEIILKPRGVWVAYLNSLPGFSQPTAYRFINGYRTAKEKYTPAVLTLILSSGMQMIGDAKNPYGKYSDVVKNLPPPDSSGDNAKDEVAARAWLNQVEAKYKDSRKKGAKTFNTAEAQKEIFRFCVKRISKVPDNHRIKFISETFGYVLGNLQLTEDMAIEPKTPPQSFSEAKGDAA